MTRAWTTLAAVRTPEGLLELRQRGPDDFLILVGGRVLMTSAARRSEEEMGRLAATAIARRPAPRVLVGGLGMAYTLRAALDALPAAARVVVRELSPEVVAWCRGPLAPLTGRAVDDPRVTIEPGDVAEAIAAATELDAIVLDLYEGPSTSTQPPSHPIYGARALARARAALAAGGVLAIWGEDRDPAFPARLAAAGFEVTERHPGRGGRAHVVYLGISRSGRSGSRRRPG